MIGFIVSRPENPLRTRNSQRKSPPMRFATGITL